MYDGVISCITSLFAIFTIIYNDVGDVGDDGGGDVGDDVGDDGGGDVGDDYGDVGDGVGDNVGDDVGDDGDVIALCCKMVLTRDPVFKAAAHQSRQTVQSNLYASSSPNNQHSKPVLFF